MRTSRVLRAVGAWLLGTMAAGALSFLVVQAAVITKATSVFTSNTLPYFQGTNFTTTIGFQDPTGANQTYQVPDAGTSGTFVFAVQGAFANVWTVNQFWGSPGGATTIKLDPSDGSITENAAKLTAATMTAETTGQVRNVIHSYTWTNAMVTALGATTAGDISVATLPAKEIVTNAYVIILTPDTSTNALTVACGRTSATYIDYIVASDAKAAANTVYGDASAERGTNLTGYDLPSYTGTTTVNCHFIKTTTNLNTVTGSTGRVILETMLVP